MIPLERQRSILRLLDEQGTISISTLMEALDVSHMTVRRDIRRLEELGRVVSVAGGISLPVRLAFDQARTIKEGLQEAEKAAIALAAASFAAVGDLVFLDAGTTTLAIARHLAQREGVSFLTNDLAIASLLSDRSTNDLFVASGRIDRANLSAEGPLAAAAIAGFNIDVAFISASSFDLHGTSVPSEDKLVVKKAITAASQKRILVSDSTKYGKVACHRAIPLEDFDAIITDTALTASAIDRIRQLEVPLSLVSPKH